MTAVVSALLLSGCSQVASLTPVSGGPLATVRNAVNDVLVSNNVAILVAPVCTETTQQFECTGSTSDGKPITATATLTTPYSMTVKVGDQSLYDGSVQDVLDQAAEAK